LFIKINKQRLLEEVFSSSPNNGVELQQFGPTAPNNNQLELHIESLSTMYPHSLHTTDSMDEYNPGNVVAENTI